MDASIVGLLISGGFFTLIVGMIARTVSRLHMAKLEAERQAASGTGSGHEELVAALDELRREVAELAERVDFTERLLGQRGADRLGPPRP